jgi:hypothetical protein
MGELLARRERHAASILGSRSTAGNRGGGIRRLFSHQILMSGARDSRRDGFVVPCFGGRRELESRVHQEGMMMLIKW